MGITNANAFESFQKMINKVLEGLLHVICEVSLDDIILFSTTLEEHFDYVRLVVQRLDEHNLKIKIEKCKVAQEVICYLSHIISHG